MHDVASATVEYVPVAQTRHVLSDLYLPATQVAQWTIDELPGGDKEPCGHKRQVDEVVAVVEFEYVPLGHATHAEDPTTPEYVPAGQAAHETAALAPTSAEYVPVGQATHDPDLVSHMLAHPQHCRHAASL